MEKIQYHNKPINKSLMMIIIMVMMQTRVDHVAIVKEVIIMIDKKELYPTKSKDLQTIENYLIDRIRKDITLFRLQEKT